MHTTDTTGRWGAIEICQWWTVEIFKSKLGFLQVWEYTKANIQLDSFKSIKGKIGWVCLTDFWITRTNIKCKIEAEIIKE